MKKILAIIFSCIIHVSCAQAKPENGDSVICWQEGIKLKWRDFQSKSNASKNSKFGANTSAEIGIEAFVDDKGKDNFLVSCFFRKANSWVRDSTFLLEFVLLAHEQSHFDIAEIIARKLRKTIHQSYSTGQGVFGPVLGKEIECLLDEEVEWQTLYDNETAHGVIADEQRRWTALIKSELYKYKTYKSSATTCK